MFKRYHKHLPLVDPFELIQREHQGQKNKRRIRRMRKGYQVD